MKWYYEERGDVAECYEGVDADGVAERELRFQYGDGDDEDVWESYSEGTEDCLNMCSVNCGDVYSSGLSLEVTDEAGPVIDVV